LLWVPAHRGIEGNEKTNILAKKEAATPFTASEPFCGLGDYTCKHELNLNTKEPSFGSNSLDWRTLRNFL